MSFSAMKFSCRFCGHETEIFLAHLDHHKCHRNLTRDFHCGYEACTEFFTSVISLRMHLIRMHNVALQSGGNFRNSSLDACADERLKFYCTLESCRKELDDSETFLKHLKRHISEGTPIKCPISNCLSTVPFSVVSSFTGHLSKFHKKTNLNDLSSPDLQNDQPFVSDDIIFEENIDFEYSEKEYEPEPVTYDLFLQNLAELFLNLEVHYMIPATTIQHLVTELHNLQNQHKKAQSKTLRDILIAEQVPSSKAIEIIKKFELQNSFLQSLSTLKSDYRRKKFYKERFLYVKPIEKFLCVQNGKKKFFHYVPIIETIKAMFKDISLHPISLVSHSSGDNILRDVFDGTVYKSNGFFNDNLESIKIIIYQDSFEIVNPLGSARGKYKILAVYLTLGNLPDYVRSHVNSIQLVALCREKLFDPDMVYGAIVEEIKQIETEGIEISPNKRVRGTLLFIAGDNLGNHQLGGFVENFSKSKFFCRFCLIHRDGVSLPKIPENNTRKAPSPSPIYSEENFCNDSSDLSCDTVDSSDCEEQSDGDWNALEAPLFSKPHEKRTVDSYKKALIHMKSGEKIGESFQGIKFDSIFNTLDHYHVCMPGLCPCLGHDLLEGVVAVDIALFTKYFVDKKWFTYSGLNYRIENFKYSASDKKDQPVILAQNCKKITGGAWQNWNFLRLYPLIIGDKIKNIEDPVWYCLLNLSEIVEIIFAPEVHVSWVPYLQLLINEYLFSRAALFPQQNLLPKHHFLTHYPKLILEFGPLLRVWTLRFESKHCFFKQFMRLLRNFKNVTLSLTEKHELFQALQRRGAGLRNLQKAKNEKPLLVNLFPLQMQELFAQQNLDSTAMECSQIVVKGTIYRKGNVVILAKEPSSDTPAFGKICIIIKNCSEKIYFVLEILNVIFNPQLRVYVLGSAILSACVCIEELLSYEPLHIYTVNTCKMVRLKHGLVKYQIPN